MSNGDFMSIKESQGTSEIMVTVLNQWGTVDFPLRVVKLNLLVIIFQIVG